jgi:acylpyruvate hydrolase
VRLLTFRTADGTQAGRLDGQDVVPLDYPDVAALFASGSDWASRAAAASANAIPLDQLDLAPPVLVPSKVFCVGLNYLLHIQEGSTERDRPSHPTLFAKFADSITGPNDPIVVPNASNAVDWEAELVVVVGRTVRNADESEAAEAIAGFTVGNDLSMRDWQQRTAQWLQGKAWDKGSPIGPCVVTPDELGGVRPDLRIGCEVDGEIMQDARTSALLFDPVHLVSYASTVITLRPGDLIFTGTPEGVGAARTPPIFLKPGHQMRTFIEGIGELHNEMVADPS